MKATEWKKYESGGNDGFPSGLSVELCEKFGEKVEFDNKYSEFYFLPEDDERPVPVIGDNGKKLNPPVDLKKSCKWVEDKIYTDCEKPMWRAADILRILAWKTGKINHSKCMGTKPKIQYDANWAEGKAEDSFVSLQIPYQSVVKWNAFDSISSSIISMRADYCRSDRNQTAIQAAWTSILGLANQYKDAMRGIGTVYLITLLHFITDGEVPIYDRFAMASLAVWKLKSEEKGVTITDTAVVRGCKLPSKDSKAAETILESGIYAEYIKLLKEFCKANYGNENEWKKNRDVDRALWVFGHFFEVDE